MAQRTIHWNDLPHNNYVGHGREGLVLRLSENESIKIYSPERSMAADLAFYNAKKLKGLGFLVPEPKELVKVELVPEAKLPVYNAQQVARLRPVGPNAKNVTAVIQEYFDGEAFGQRSPSYKELEKIGKYLERLHEHDLSFYEGISLDFIALKDRRVGLVDCTTLVDRESFDRKNGRFDYFDELSLDYQARIFDSLRNDLELNGHLDLLTSAKLSSYNFLQMFKM